ncbi:MAG TPA: UvrD-helicase domain-containing protein [Caldilineae bacterium]|nr:UvrD-helicase domain-containing protein [Caldilineae bacterium]
MFDLASTILSQLALSDQQAAAALSPAAAIAVTAGAGSGKTRTLVGRYLWLVEQGFPVRSLVAITFTEKAAREMRNRIREKIGLWRNETADAKRRTWWDEVAAALDSARIGTIHSLCAAILRGNPAEAGVDPRFEVLEENMAILLRARALEDALAWAGDDPVCASLFGPLGERDLRATVDTLLGRRLDAEATFRALGEDALAHWSGELAAWFDAQLAGPAWQSALTMLASISARKSGDKMELARQAVLAHWAAAQAARAARDWEQVGDHLRALRKAATNFGTKGNWAGDDLALAREAMRTLRSHYDDHLKPVLGAPSTPLASWTLDRQMAALEPALLRLFEQALTLYEAMKAERQALDFDDLESMAAALLTEHPAVRERWQSEIAAVLVDEFQDTNARQREIVYQITGFREAQVLDIGDSVLPVADSTSNLFIVGDGKQSIYRFRGADVRVFRQAQADIRQNGGRLVDLDVTYRAHADLVGDLNALLAPILGEANDSLPAYVTPFAPLHPWREKPAAWAQRPYLEFHLGLGKAEEGRTAAAAGLAARLHELHEQGGAWQDMALLFRASTAFGVYEDALEAAGIPYVTVAGRGFYNRPEVRDLLNALAAVADPSDDLALAGLLRSPAFGLSDAALYLLRWRDERGREARSFWQALHDEAALALLDASDAKQAVRAREVVGDLHQQAGRTSVAGVLKQLLDETFYRAALRLAGGGERASRNVDKLLADAHRSQLVGVGDFLEYVRNLREAEAREGEAVAEAGDAVQLMTVHKAKGLEFPIVVIADASYSGGRRSAPLFIDEAFGPLLRIRAGLDDKSVPFMHRLAQRKNDDMDEAESRRLLYVAATRVREKLLISAYCKTNKSGGLQMTGWLQWLGAVAGLTDIRPPDALSTTQHESLLWREGAAELWLYPAADDLHTQHLSPRISAPRSPLSDPSPLTSDLVAPLSPPPAPKGDSPSLWRVTPTSKRPRAPRRVVGVLVHKALQRWRFPGDPEFDFDAFLWPFVRESGLVDERQTENAMTEAVKLLRRFRRHELFRQLDGWERRHEMPYVFPSAQGVDRGVIDLLARPASDANWQVYDFKTDYVKPRQDLQDFARGAGYVEQVQRYVSALESLLGYPPLATLVFLNVGGAVKLVPC